MLFYERLVAVSGEIYRIGWQRNNIIVRHVGRAASRSHAARRNLNNPATTFLPHPASHRVYTISDARVGRRQ